MLNWLNELIQNNQRKIHQETLNSLPFPDANFFGTGVPCDRAKALGDAFRSGDEEKYDQLLSQEIDSAQSIGQLFKNTSHWRKK